MTNMELLRLLQTVTQIHIYTEQKYNEAFSSGSREDFEKFKDTCAIGYNQIRGTIQNQCSHPIGIKVGLQVYCPICEIELDPESVIVISKEASGANIDFIKEKISEVLPLIPEVTPAQMAEYVDRELKTIER